MRKHPFTGITQVLAVAGIILAVQRVAIGEGAGGSGKPESSAAHDARMKWWREARFGMFVHWGLYSGLAGTWEGKPAGTTGGMEWIQQRVKADTDTYAARGGAEVQTQTGLCARMGAARERGGLQLCRVHHQTSRGLRAARLQGGRFRCRLDFAARPGEGNRDGAAGRGIAGGLLPFRD